MLEVTKIGTKNYTYFAPLLFEQMDADQKAILPDDGFVRIGVMDDGVACGAASFQVEETMAQLVSVYVTEKHRRKGAATALFDTFTGLAEKKNITALSVSCAKENEDLKAFLDATGFQLFDSASAYGFSLADVAEAHVLLADMKRALDQRKENWQEVFSFRELQPYQQMEFRQYLKNNGWGTEWLREGEFAPDLSFVVLDIKKKIVAFMICSQQEDGVNIDLLYGAGKGPTALLLLFAELYRTLKKNGQEDLKITYLAENPQMEALGQRLFGEHLEKVTSLIYAIRLMEA